MEINMTMLVLIAIGFFVQIFMSLRKKWFWGLLLIAFSISQVIYWLGNPIPEGHKPTMTALNAFPWIGVTIIYTAIYLICSLVKKEDNNQS